MRQQKWRLGWLLGGRLGGLVGLLLTGCAVAPPVTTPTTPDLSAVVIEDAPAALADTRAATSTEPRRLVNGACHFQLQGDQNVVLVCLRNGVRVAVWATHTAKPKDPDPPPPPPIGGDVFLQGRAFADDTGAQIALGASYFSALHRERVDRAGLRANLRWLSTHGVTYVRILSMVGSQPFWAGRVIDPTRPGYFTTLVDLIADALAAGIRLQVVLFADADDMMPRQSDRLAWVDTMAAFLELHRPAVQFVEIANESDLNGVTNADLAELTRRWEAISTIPVAPSSVGGSNDPETALEHLYATEDLCADLLTPHFQRGAREDGYRHWRQPWEVHDYDGTCTTVYVNNEPQRDTNAGRIAVGMANTLIAGGAGFTWHTDAGVRGRRDFAEEPNGTAVLAALTFVRDTLPATTANGEYCNHHHDCHPYEDFDQIWPETGGTGVVRAYSNRVGGVTSVALTGLKGQYAMVAKWDMTIEVLSLCTQRRTATVMLDAGDFRAFLPTGGCRDFIHRVTRR